ncbi:MFS transporter [Cystobacter ferrugineus]|uniref:MFS transporter n=1 Tax=Cystobacter ferrugineus TaxID=83449 RepID=A0A1L9B8I0_9BACT|nr:MFS transporter [Cystobacter ferrugineus]OJH38566.1 MFS transporter [Cystobacter ferrugineus]
MEDVSTVSTVGERTRTRVRYFVLFMVFIVTTLNFADRATLSITGSTMQKELGLDSVQMGYLFSAFAWAYVLGQLPGGWLLDRFGTKRVYAWSIALWSFFTLLAGVVGALPAASVVGAFFLCRLMVGFAEAPAFPGNSRLVAAWFPTAERGTASAIFNSAQYFATVLFTPLMAYITHAHGWRSVYFVMGGLGLALAALWLFVIHEPKAHPRISRAELEYIERGGGLVSLEQGAAAKAPLQRGALKQLLANRMMMGIYVGQYCINTLTYFFLTWFPVYLVQERGMSILKAGFVSSLPAVAGFIGGVLGGVISDGLVRRGHSLTFARKTPIVAGMLMSTSMVVCNYVDSQWLVVAIMSLAFFGKGVGALGWAVMSDTSPKQIAGLSGGVFNTFGNMAGITTPIIIGYLLKQSGSFAAALVFVGANALLAIFCYLLVVGEIRRLELKPA